MGARLARRPRLAAVLLGLSLLAGCAETKSKSDGDAHRPNEAGEKGPGDVVLDPGRGTAGTLPNGQPAGEQAAGDTSAGSRDRPAGLDAFPADWIAGKPGTRNADDPRLMDCTLERGSICKLHITGWYKLGNFPSGSITAAVYEDDNTEPAQETTSGIPVPKGASRWFIDLPYRVSATAKHISVEAVLNGPSGQVLYRGERHTYRIP